MYIDSQLVGARYSEQSMDGIKNMTCLAEAQTKNHPLEHAHHGVRVLPYLMTDELIRAGDGQGWTEQNIQAPDLRT